MKHFYVLLLLIISFNISAQIPAYTATVNANAPGGYYFVEPISLTHPTAYNAILDSAGNVVYYNQIPHLCFGWALQPNGLMSYFDNTLLKFILMDSAFNVVDTIAAKNGYTTDPHELLILQNKHYLLLAEENAIEDLRNYNYFDHNGSPGDSAAVVQCAIIQELDSSKNVVFEWHAKDYLPFDGVDPFFLAAPNIVDWTHSNALEVDTDGNILMSSRHFDAIIKINRQDSSVIWQFGGRGNQFRYTGSDSVPFYGQHDIRRISNGDYTLYDDGNHYIPHGARACEFKLDVTNMTAQLVWSYTYDSSMYSSAMGRVQRLPQSPPLTLTDYGLINDSSNICFDVVDSSGTEVFKLLFNDTLISYRASNYSSLPWALNRPQISCLETYSTLYLDAGGGHSSYLWSNGSTSRTIAVTTADTFSVFVNYGQGGFISSVPIIVTDPYTYCQTTSVSELQPDNSIKIFPNPAHDRINILFNTSGNNASDYIYARDLTGRTVAMPLIDNDVLNNSFSYNISSLSSGFYFLSVGSQSFKFVKD